MTKNLLIKPLEEKDKKKTFKIAVPGSKSYTNRALLIASLAKGESVLTNVLHSDDTKVMIDALRELGVKITEEGTTLRIKGCNGKFKKPKKELYFGNAGTGVRFMASTLAIQNFECTITGNPRMLNRPIKGLVDALRQGGAEIEYLGTEGFPPLRIKGGFEGGKIQIPGNTSSQYVSSLLLISPYTKKPTDIVVGKNLVSKPYVDMTIEIMRAFNVTKGKRLKYQRFIISNKTSYRGTTYNIDADASSASYFFALGALHGTAVTITNAKYNSAQGDIKFVDLLKKAGCEVKIDKKEGITVKGPEKKDAEGRMLKSLGNVDMNAMPDVALTMAIISVFSKGKTRLKNIPNLRVKECDRILAMTSGLNRINCKARQMADGMEIKGHPHKCHGAEIETYDDHRVAMCFGVLGTLIPEIVILEPECVSKTYPNFWKDLKKFGVKTEKK